MSLRKFVVMTGLVVASAGVGHALYRYNSTVAGPGDSVEQVFRPLPKDAVTCEFDSKPRPLMVLVLGQSNAGNHGSALTRPEERNKTTFLFEGTCYRTAGPAPGATGSNGNIWTGLAPRLVLATGRPVVFSVLAVDATRVGDWIEPGKLRQSLLATLASNREHSFVPEVVIWQQGEADARAGTTEREYRIRFANLVQLLRNQGIDAPIITALATRCRNDGSEEIRTALRELAATDSSIRLGPDTDALTGLFRESDCHFSASGLEAAAQLWLAAIAALRPP